MISSLLLHPPPEKMIMIHPPFPPSTAPHPASAPSVYTHCRPTHVAQNERDKSIISGIGTGQGRKETSWCMMPDDELEEDGDVDGREERKKKYSNFRETGCGDGRSAGRYNDLSCRYLRYLISKFKNWLYFGHATQNCGTSHNLCPICEC